MANSNGGQNEMTTLLGESISEVVVEDSVVQEIVETEDLEKTHSTDKLPEKSEKLLQMPLTRIKSIIKLDPDVTLASQEAVIMIAKATELFVESLAKESYKYTKQNKKKTIQKKDIDDCIDATEEFAFLEGALE